MAIPKRSNANHLIRETTAKAILVRGHWRKESVSVSGIFRLRATSNGFASGDTIDRWIVFADNYPIPKNTGNFLADAEDWAPRKSAYEAELIVALGLQEDGYDRDDVALWEVRMDGEGAFVSPDSEYYENYCRAYDIDPSYQVPFVRCLATSGDRKAFVIEELLEIRGTRVHRNGAYDTIIGKGNEYTEKTGKVSLIMEDQ